MQGYILSEGEGQDRSKISKTDKNKSKICKFETLEPLIYANSQTVPRDLVSMYPVSHPLHVNLTEHNTLKNRAPSQDTVVGRNSGSPFISQSNQSGVQPPVEASALGKKLLRFALSAGLGQGSATNNLEAAGPGVQATSVR